MMERRLTSAGIVILDTQDAQAIPAQQAFVRAAVLQCAGPCLELENAFDEYVR